MLGAIIGDIAGILAEAYYGFPEDIKDMFGIIIECDKKDGFK